MSNNKKPDIRFEDYFDDWEQCKLKSIAEISSGGTPDRKNSSYWKGNIPWVTTSEVNYSIIEDTNEKITKNGLINSSAKIVPNGTILMAMYGQGKTRGKVGILGIEAATNQANANIQVNQRNNSFFIYYQLVKAYESLRNLANEGGQANLSLSIVKNIDVTITNNIEEQEIIGVLFTRIDRTITLHQRQLTKSKQFKQSMLQKMFPREGQTEPEIRFEGFTERWEEVALGSITSYHSSNYTVNDVKKDGKFPIYDAQTLIGHIDTYAINRPYISIVKDGAGVGRVRLLPPKSSVIATMGYISPKNNLCDVMYLYNSLLNFDFSKFIVGSTIPHIYYKDYSDEIIHLPSLQEQKAVGTFFKKLEKKITVQEQKLTKIKQFKQAMLQKMFV